MGLVDLYSDKNIVTSRGKEYEARYYQVKKLIDSFQLCMVTHDRDMSKCEKSYIRMIRYVNNR